MQKLLFTPGPLTTSKTVKEAMLEDMGSRDNAFLLAVKDIRNGLLELAHVSKDGGYECVIVQGSGTFGVESVIGSVVGATDNLLILVNGAYGERIVKMAKINQIHHEVLRFEEDEIVTPEATEKYLQAHPGITHVACIHCETTTGLFNPIEAIGKPTPTCIANIGDHAPAAITTALAYIFPAEVETPTAVSASIKISLTATPCRISAPCIFEQRAKNVPSR